MYYKLTIAYDGTRYKGWQKQTHTDATIQGKLEAVLSKIFDQPIDIHGSGRTDAGVHALAQIASFKATKIIQSDVLINTLNRYLPEDISVQGVALLSEPFHARFDAKKKTYVYRIWQAVHPPIFERKYVAQHVSEKLNLHAMRQAATHFIGTHDFKAFSTEKSKKSTVRTIEKIDIHELEHEVQVHITGDGFLHNMVRIIVGTLIEVGLDQYPMATIPSTLAHKDRIYAGETAPACGLILKSVTY